jgi:hypothetical protein
MKTIAMTNTRITKEIETPIMLINQQGVTTKMWGDLA